MFVAELGVTTGTPPPPAHSMKFGVAGQPRASPVQVPAYLHKTARPGATPNTKVCISGVSGVCSLISLEVVRISSQRNVYFAEH